jgi:mannose-6-phosphate isomerase-like protein (cupin superfamily)
MKCVPESNSIIVKVTETCTVTEYPDGDKEIWGAVVKVNGRYPQRGFTVNQKCKELVYFMRGKGRLVLEHESINVKKGDQVVINPGEKFYWEGKLVMFMPCFPAWYPQQHKVTE